METPNGKNSKITNEEEALEVLRKIGEERLEKVDRVEEEVPEELREEVRSMLASWLGDRNHGAD